MSTDTSVDITSIDFDAIKSTKCPVDKPFMCTTKTDAMGLCRKSPQDCRDRNLDHDLNSSTASELNKESNQFGYHTNNITDFADSANPSLK